MGLFLIAYAIKEREPRIYESCWYVFDRLSWILLLHSLTMYPTQVYFGSQSTATP